MVIFLSILSSFFFARAVILRGRGTEAILSAVSAWAIGTTYTIANRIQLKEELVFSEIMLVSCGLAGLAFLGIKFGRWLGAREVK